MITFLSWFALAVVVAGLTGAAVLAILERREATSWHRTMDWPPEDRS